MTYIYVNLVETKFCSSSLLEKKRSVILSSLSLIFMRTIQGQSTFFRNNKFFSAGGSEAFASTATRNQPRCFGGLKQVHFNKDPNNPWQPIRKTSHQCIKEALKYECCRWKIELLTNWKCLLEVRIILWKPLWVLEYLQSVQIGHCVQCYCRNMPWDF